MAAGPTPARGPGPGVFSTAPSVVMVVVVAVAASLARATAPETLEGDLLEEVAVEAAEEEVVEEAGGTARSADLSVSWEQPVVLLVRDRQAKAGSTISQAAARVASGPPAVTVESRRINAATALRVDWASSPVGLLGLEVPEIGIVRGIKRRRRRRGRGKR